MEAGAKPKLRLVLVDDHAMVRDALTSIIDAEPDMEVVGQTGEGVEAVALASKLSPDIVVMDISMPDLDGFRATEDLKKVCPSCKVLALTRHTEPGYAERMLESGADGYALKKSSARELVAAIRAVAETGEYLDPSIAQQLARTVLNRSGRSRTTKKLTPREEEVLIMVAHGLSNKEIAHRLSVSTKTIEAHKASCMEKLGMQGRPQIIQYALSRGWLKP